AIVRQGRAVGVPERARPRLVVLLEVVGVDVDEARDQPVGAPIERGRRGGRPPLDLHDLAAAQHGFAARQPVGRDDALAEDTQLGHGQAATLKSATGKRRVATASRTSWSWKMPIIAAPRASASWIRSTTTARLSPSSEAVGSSSSITGYSRMK